MILNRYLLPEPWRVILILLLFCCCWSLGWHVGKYNQDHNNQWVHIIIWMIAVFLWWSTLTSRACKLIYAMLSLKLPGCYRVALTAMAIHLLFSIVLPLILLLVFIDSQTNISLLSGALLLSAALALWTLSLPNILWFLPMLLLFSSSYWFRLPTSAAEFWGLALLLLLATSLLWRWHSRKIATSKGWLEPTFMLLETPALKALAGDSWFEIKVNRWGADRATTRSHLAQILGPGLQAPSQLFNKRAFIASLIIFPAWLLLMFHAEFKPSFHLVLINGLIVLCTLMALYPSNWLRQAQAQRGASLLANLHLLPGIPSNEQLLHAICKQVVRIQAEQLLLLGSMAVLIGKVHNIIPPVIWLQWLIFWMLLMLPFSVLSVLLTCRFTSNKWRWLVFGLLMIAGIATSYLLLDGNIAHIEWLLPFWFLISAAILIAIRSLYSSIQRRGIPYFG